MSIAPDAPYPHFPVRGDWLALHDEPVLEPDCPIVDAHHHLWDRPGNRYFLSDFLEDAASGHRIEASVFMECGAMYRRSGPPERATPIFRAPSTAPSWPCAIWGGAKRRPE